MRSAGVRRRRGFALAAASSVAALSGGTGRAAPPPAALLQAPEPPPAPAPEPQEEPAQPQPPTFALAELESRVQSRTLSNGLRVLFLDRRSAPVVSFHTYVGVGSAREGPGETGLAHLFEHMAFKGTTTIGSKDPDREQAALARVEDAAASLEEAERAGLGPDEVERRRGAFEAARAEAASLVEKEEFSRAIAEAGGVGLNATTSNDATQYFCSLPANKLLLWAFLESERFRDPVLREFHQEREVVKEERRRRAESNPTGKLLEAFLGTAFRIHPYGHPVVGYMADLERLTPARARDFFRRHYVPANTVLAIVGDLPSQDAFRTVETWFGRLPAVDPAPQPDAVETAQDGERRVAVEADAEPVVVAGWHRPPASSPDDAVYDAIADLLAVGRSSRLYRALVKEQEVAVSVSAYPAFPGQRHPTLFALLAVPAAGRTAEALERAMLDEIERLRLEGVTAEELEPVKARALAEVLRSMRTNAGLAASLARYEGLTGSYRNLFRRVERIAAVTAEDVRRVAEECFEARNRTVGTIVRAAPAGARP